MLSPDELNWIESLGLPLFERHQLRLMAHGLRTLQTIAGRAQGAVPSRMSIEHWVSKQPRMAEDALFCQSFVQELTKLADQLDQLARERSLEPLSLELIDLQAWISQKPSPRPDLGGEEPNCDHRNLIPEPSP